MVCTPLSRRSRRIAAADRLGNAVAVVFGRCRWSRPSSPSLPQPCQRVHRLRYGVVEKLVLRMLLRRPARSRRLGDREEAGGAHRFEPHARVRRRRPASSAAPAHRRRGRASSTARASPRPGPRTRASASIRFSSSSFDDVVVLVHPQRFQHVVLVVRVVLVERGRSTSSSAAMHLARCRGRSARSWRGSGRGPRAPSAGRAAVDRLAGDLRRLRAAAGPRR